jgi:hypothetical protein
MLVESVLCRARSWLSCGMGSGVVMARHRRPLAAAVPPELLEFQGERASFEAWCDARMRWVKAHPGSALGSSLDVLRGNRAARQELMGWKD